LRHVFSVGDYRPKCDGFVTGPAKVLSEQAKAKTRRCTMLWTIFFILLILWMLGMVTSYTLGGYIHILLILAVVALLIRIIQGRNPID
jgi:hypothetical protein